MHKTVFNIIIFIFIAHRDHPCDYFLRSLRYVNNYVCDTYYAYTLYTQLHHSRMHSAITCILTFMCSGDPVITFIHMPGAYFKLSIQKCPKQAGPWCPYTHWPINDTQALQTSRKKAACILITIISCCASGMRKSAMITECWTIEN